jgi:hypothetical protein
MWYENKNMGTLVTGTNIGELFAQFIIEKTQAMEMLDVGDLLSAEELIGEAGKALLTEATGKVLKHFCENKLKQASQSYESSEYGRYQTTTTTVYLSTGEPITLPDLYARKCKEDVPAGHRFVLRRHFSILGDSTPKCYSLISLAAVACPSYESANELLTHFSLNQCISRVRNLTNELGRFCHGKEADLIVNFGENLKGKKVIISLDGGRCRTREYSEKRNAAGNRQFDTDWREPKLFVIQVLDEDGNLEQESKPIYGIRFHEAEFWELLESVLKKLEIEGAENVQVIADGAQWIWDEIEVFLMRLGVSAARIKLTLDYYHAATYLGYLLKSLPKGISEKKRKEVEAECKDLIWSGKSVEAVEKIASLKKRPTKEEQRWRNYLTKHQSKMQYADNEAHGWMCGSGIVESAIRRVINQRFKNTGTFWHLKNVERLMFLRGTYLSGRWNILMSNIVNNVF